MESGVGTTAARDSSSKHHTGGRGCMRAEGKCWRGGAWGERGGELLKVFIGGERVLRRVGESAMGWDGGV